MNNDIAKNISLIHRAYQKYMTSSLQEINISCSEYPLLLALSRNDGVGQNELSRIVKMNKSLASRSIQSLVGKDLIYIKQDEHSCRKSKLHLTEKCHSILPIILKYKSFWIDKTLDNFTNDEKNLFMDMLDRILISSTALQGD